MNLKLSVLLFFSLSGAAIAASNSFRASVVAQDEANINETSALHFGTILNTPGASCSIDSLGTATGECSASDANVAVGVVNISGLIANQAYQVDIVGSDNGMLRFSPAVTIDSVEILDGDGDQTISMTTTQTDDNTDILVYGNLEVLTLLSVGTTYRANYTVSVNFQ